MAVFLPDSRALLLVLALVTASGTLLAASPRALPKGTNLGRVLNIDAGSWEVDYNSHHLVMRDVTISQGTLSIKAREAEANGPDMSFDGSRWEFRGDVRITFDTGNLAAEKAIVTFTGNRIARAEASGSPAEFEQKLKSMSEPAKGRAGNIDYDISAGRVTLTKGTWFTDGRNEYRSEALVYNVREQRLQSGGDTQAAPTSGGRIHITIHPDEKEGAPEQPTP
jgi:lipopolysaccharide transport protein LptA